MNISHLGGWSANPRVWLCNWTKRSQGHCGAGGEWFLVDLNLKVFLWRKLPHWETETLKSACAYRAPKGSDRQGLGQVPVRRLWSDLVWKRPLKSLIRTINSALARLPLKHAPKCHTYMYFICVNAWHPFSQFHCLLILPSFIWKGLLWVCTADLLILGAVLFTRPLPVFSHVEVPPREV